MYRKIENLAKSEQFSGPSQAAPICIFKKKRKEKKIR